MSALELGQPGQGTRQGPPMVHIVWREWPGGPVGDLALCGKRGPWLEPAGDRPVDCVVCAEIMRAKFGPNEER